MAAAVGAIEDILREYLLYRGFVLTLKAFDQERKEDKDKGLRVSRTLYKHLDDQTPVIIVPILTILNRSRE